MATALRVTGRPFQKGVSGNPAGRPFGARNKTTVMAERLLASDAAEIVGVITGAAKAGDVGACRALLAYIVAPVREAPLPAINLPPCDDAAGVSECQSAIFAAAAAGRLTATEAQALSSLLEARRRSLETVELEARLRALEKGSPR